MGIRFKLLGVISLVFAGLLGTLSVLISTILAANVTLTEKSDMVRDIARINAYLDREVEDLEKIILDENGMSSIDNLETDHLTDDFSDKSFEDLDLNMILFLSKSGEVVYEQGYDNKSEEYTLIPPEIYEELQAGNRLVTHNDLEDRTAGLLLVSETPLIIVSAPIIK